MDPQTDSSASVPATDAPVVLAVPVPVDTAQAARAAAVRDVYAAYEPDRLADPTPVTGGRGVEVDDVVGMLAELKVRQGLDRLL